MNISEVNNKGSNKMYNNIVSKGNVALNNVLNKMKEKLIERAKKDFAEFEPIVTVEFTDIGSFLYIDFRTDDNTDRVIKKHPKLNDVDWDGNTYHVNLEFDVIDSLDLD